MGESLKCVHCLDEGQIFDSKSFWRHYQENHQGFKIECMLCENKFRRQCDQVEHLGKYHQKLKLSKIIACVHCDGHTFGKERGLSDHYDDVHRKFKIPCKYCGNLFLNKSILREHEENCLTWQQKG